MSMRGAAMYPNPIHPTRGGLLISGRRIGGHPLRIPAGLGRNGLKGAWRYTESLATTPPSYWSPMYGTWRVN